MKQDNFVLISDPRIWAMPVIECGEALVDLKEIGIQLSLTRAPFYNGYSKVRTPVAEKLIAAQKKLPHGLKFLFSEGHRPVSLQKQMHEEYYKLLVQNHPSWTETQIKQEVAKYIAPPEDVPPHSTGGAFDITLIDESGLVLDMGSILDELPENNGDRNFTFTANISEQAKKNRRYLIDALTGMDFVNYPAEWWHWSYGDKYWAFHSHKSHAIYHSIEETA